MLLLHLLFFKEQQTKSLVRDQSMLESLRISEGLSHSYLTDLTDVISHQELADSGRTTASYASEGDIENIQNEIKSARKT